LNGRTREHWVVFVEVVIEHDFGNAPHAWALPIANQMSQFFLLVKIVHLANAPSLQINF